MNTFNIDKRVHTVDARCTANNVHTMVESLDDITATVILVM